MRRQRLLGVVLLAVCAANAALFVLVPGLMKGTEGAMSLKLRETMTPLLDSGALRVDETRRTSLPAIRHVSADFQGDPFIPLFWTAHAFVKSREQQIAALAMSNALVLGIAGILLLRRSTRS